jgi:hypothetical protein
MNETLRKRLFGHRDDRPGDTLEQIGTHPFGTVLGAIGGAVLGALIGLAAGPVGSLACALGGAVLGGLLGSGRAMSTPAAGPAVKAEPAQPPDEQRSTEPPR